MSKSIFSLEIGSKLAPNLPEPVQKTEAVPAVPVAASLDLAFPQFPQFPAASADVAMLDKQDEIVVVSADPYKGPVVEQAGLLGDKIKVPVIPAGHLDKEQVKKGAAGRVLMPSGAIIPAGGELLQLALRNGGKLLET